MNLQSLYEMEMIIEELVASRMSIRQQKRVVAIRHSFGIVSNCLENGFVGKHDRRHCQKALVKIRTLCDIGHEEGKTRQVRRRFSDLMQRVGELESWIGHEIQNTGVIEHVKTLVRGLVSWII